LLFLESLKKPIWPKKPIRGTILTPKKANERGYFAEKKPKIPQSSYLPQK